MTKKLSVEELNGKYTSANLIYKDLPNIGCDVCVEKWTKVDMNDVDIKDMRNVYFVMSICCTNSIRLTALFDEKEAFISVPAMNDDTMPFSYNNILSMENIVYRINGALPSDKDEYSNVVSILDKLKEDIIKSGEVIDDLNKQIEELRTGDDDLTFYNLIKKAEDPTEIFDEELRKSVKIYKYEDDDIDGLLFNIPYAPPFIFEENATGDVSIKNISYVPDFTYDDEGILRRKISGVFKPFKYSVKMTEGTPFPAFINSEKLVIDINTLYEIAISKVEFENLEDKDV